MCLFSADKIEIFISKSSKDKEQSVLGYRLILMIYYLDHLSLFFYINCNTIKFRVEYDVIPTRINLITN